MNIRKKSKYLSFSIQMSFTSAVMEHFMVNDFSMKGSSRLCQFYTCTKHVPFKCLLNSSDGCTLHENDKYKLLHNSHIGAMHSTEP